MSRYDDIEYYRRDVLAERDPPMPEESPLQFWVRTHPEEASALIHRLAGRDLIAEQARERVRRYGDGERKDWL